MGIKLGICFCKPGPMSTCVANNWDEQAICDFYDASAREEKRCMFKGKIITDHCWSPDAQKFGAEFGVRTLPDFTEDVDKDLNVLDLDDYIDELPSQYCGDCSKRDFCSTLVFEMNRRGGLSEGDYWDIATNCSEYEGGN